MKIFRIITLILLIIGGINWALFGLFQYNLIQDFLGAYKMWSQVAYALMGFAGLYGIKMLFSKCGHKHDDDSKCCSK